MKTIAALVGLCAIAIASAFAPARAAAPDPYQIFANARAYWLQQRYPMQLQYRIAVDVIEGGKERVEHYDARYDAVDDIVSVDPTSDYERMHPVKPTGINLGLLVPIGKPLPAIDFIGVPHLAPNYSFGMAPFLPAPTPTPFNSMALVDDIREQFHDPNPRKSKPSASPSPSLREIGAVIAQNREYSITLVDTEAIDGHDCYHLALKPMRDPGRFRIREAWIDAKTYAPWQLKDAVNFIDGPATSVPWTIRFTDLDGAHYIAQEQAGAPLSTHGEIYTSTVIRFESIAATSLPPHPVLEGTSTRDALSEP